MIVHFGVRHSPYTKTLGRRFYVYQGRRLYDFHLLTLEAMDHNSYNFFDVWTKSNSQNALSNQKPI